MRDRPKALGEHVTPLSDRPAIAGDVKPHAPVGVPAMFPDEVQPALGPVQPGAVLLHSVEQRREQLGAPALLPHTLVIIQQAPITIPG